MTETDAPADEAVSPEEQEQLDRDALFRKLRAWFRADRDASSTWRANAREDFDFVAGHQWSAADEAVLKEQGRPPITFNRVLPVIKAVAGSEVSTRQDIQYLPREVGDAALNEVLTEASRYLADEADAEDEESDAFVDAVICGVGVIEQRLDYEINPDGAYVEDRVNPIEMFWDHTATKRGLSDARRVFRAKTMDRAEAEGLFPDADASDLDAAWAEDRDGGEPHQQLQPGEHRMDRRDAADAGTDRVTIVEVQWWERKKVAIVIDPQTGEPMDMDPAQAKVLLQRAAAMGMPPVQVFHQMKRVYRRAFLGATVLEEGPAPAGDRFSYAFLTGDRDQNKGTWFGIVRPMLDPQRFANKWLSQTMDMLNRQSKGGHFAETSAVKDVRQFEASAAKPGATTWVNPGALRSGAIKEKPLPVLPSGHWQMMEFAIGSIRDSSGVNLELLGQQQNDQAGILEYHRKQAAMNILATAFNALRRARKHIGRVRLYFIQRYLSDGRLVRITGPAGQKVIPLLRDQTAGDFDVIIDEAPSSPNQQQVMWQTFVSVLPIIRDMITPQVLLEVLPYSPFPDSFVAKMRELLASQQNDPQAQQQKQMAMQQALTAIEETAAGADLKRAQAEHQRSLSTYDKVDTVGRTLEIAHGHQQVTQGAAPSPEQHRHAAPAPTPLPVDRAPFAMLPPPASAPPQPGPSAYPGQIGL
ncbi:portal protein [Methylobacterium sp. 1973]|uniref:portal protein n=1 Tax=Methylobacterium sp. 1973 TaxID=3156421 RepID=UPI003391F083